VYGLYLEGARWDIEEHRLRRSHPKVLIEELPILTIVPTQVQFASPYPCFLGTELRTLLLEYLIVRVFYFK